MSPGVPWTPLVVYLVVLAAERFGELWLSGRHVARLRARGARESGAGHFPLFVVLHAAYPVALVFEVAHGARPPASWPAWLALWLGAQALRVATMVALGERWTARVMVLPGEPLVRRGPYRWLAHPGYLAVVLEFVAAPLMFGAWWTALAASVLNALVLAVRIPVEAWALGVAAGPRR